MTSDERNRRKLLAIDLFCGLGGWAEGFLAEGYTVIGFDILPQPYPGLLVIQDVRTLHGSQFRSATVIVASPPCNEYSYRAMPWKRAKALPPPSNELFDACFRIQREASESAGRHIPLIAENVKGAQTYVGRAKWHFGSFYLWGDVPALMPFDGLTKNAGGSWFAIAHNTESGLGHNPDGRKLGDKNSFRVTGKASPHFTNPAEPGVKQHGSGPIWFDAGIAKFGSKTERRKAASALIAKIPFPLARHIAKCFSHDGI